MTSFKKTHSVTDHTPAPAGTGHHAEAAAVRSYITPEKLAQLHELLDKHDAVLRQCGEEGCTDRLLTRWLNARKGNIQHCVQSLEAHIEWRKKATPDAPKHVANPSAAVLEQLKQGKVYCQGKDKTHNPIILGVACKHQKFPSPEVSLEFCSYALDAAIAIGESDPNWSGKLTGVFDLRNMSLKNADFTALKTMFDLLQNHYPERLGTLWLYEAPFIFSGLWKMCLPFVDPITKTKIHFIYAKEAERLFSEQFDLESLPKALGGRGDFKAIDTCYQECYTVSVKQQLEQPQSEPSTQ